MNIDLKILQMICSRLCHDLVGLSSGINAGLELLADDQDIGGESFNLSKTSADQIAHRLAFFRVAFGLAEGRNGALTNFEAKNLCSHFINKQKTAIKWFDLLGDKYDQSVSQINLKVLLNLVFIAERCLPRGGEILAYYSKTAGGSGIAIEAIGESAFLSEKNLAALSKDCCAEDLDPTNVPIYLSRCIIEDKGGTLNVELKNGNDKIQFISFFPE